MYEIMLNYHNYEVLGKAIDGEEAIEKYISFNEKPDIIIIDHRMPKKNGIETMKEILKINKTAKLIFISADYTIKEEALINGASGFLIKPITESSLLMEINKILFVI